MFITKQKWEEDMKTGLSSIFLEKKTTDSVKIFLDVNVPYGEDLLQLTKSNSKTKDNQFDY